MNHPIRIGDVEIVLGLPPSNYASPSSKMVMSRLLLPRIVITQDQYDEIMKTGGYSLDWDGSAIVWDDCVINDDGSVESTPRNCEECRFKNLNQFWGCCKLK